ncbi:hypothetical protein F2Q69_00015833 [Brassica cretica]|uniref:Uncharacterized protein n=1 Tax=Brassica cretica TaxID=69181 RepID=A0A8S9QQH2_BRACR|nr:hypothetical protein F2Q69_00015833 [Brassica cretica]
MARILISSPSSFFGSPLLKPSSRHLVGGSLQFRNKHFSTTVRFSLNEIPPLHGLVDIGAILTRTFFPVKHRHVST